jgi:hypothetical protein
MAIGVSHSLNQLSAEATLLGQAGGGGYGIISGLGLSVVTGLNIAVAPGIALVDGFLELVSSSPYGLQVQVPPPYTLPDASTSYVWLTQTGALISSTSTSPPTNARIFLGTTVTASGAISSIDSSGVVSITGGRLQRRTADAFAPLDSPPSGMNLFTQTTFGNFVWDGLSHKALVDLGKQLLSPSLTQSLTGTLTLAATSPNRLYLTASGGDQTVLLPLASTLPPGWNVTIYNVGASHSVVVKDSTGATTYATLTAGQAVAAATYLNSSGATIFPSTWSAGPPAGAVPVA